MFLKRQIRDEIEQSIKNLNVNRERFYEVSKLSYQSIVKKIIYKYGNENIKRHCTMSSIYYSLNEKIPYWYTSLYKFENLLKILQDTLPNPTEKVYLIINDAFEDIYLCRGLQQCMVYEGYINEIYDILMDSGFFDFYICTKKFENLIAYCDDGEVIYFIGRNFRNIKEYIKIKDIKLYCHSDTKEYIRLDFTAYIDKDKNTMWEDWHIGDECLVVYQTDYNILLIPYFEKIYPFKEPITDTLETHFDVCFDNWFNKENCYKIIELIQNDIANKTKKEQKFYSSFVEWISKQLQFADGIVVEGNL